MRTRSVAGMEVGRCGTACKKRDGFTLIELLIVVAVIGILAGITILSFVKYENKTLVSRVFADFRVIGEGLERYAMDNIKYPTEDDGLDALAPDYITSVPEDPFSDGAYRYYTDAGTDEPGNAWLLVSHGPDGTEDVGEPDLSWVDADRVSGQLGGDDGALSGYGLAAGDDGWYDPENGDGSDGDLGRGGP